MSIPDGEQDLKKAIRYAKKREAREASKRNAAATRLALTGNGGIMTGFYAPRENWSKLPHTVIELLPAISGNELKILLYIIRHTWGYYDEQTGGQETDKRITIDEFMHGRKRKDGTRLDGGVGLSEHTVIDIIRNLQEMNLITRESDGKDLGRRSYYYSLNIIGD